MGTNPADVPASTLSLQISVDGDSAHVKCIGYLVAGVTDLLSSEVKQLLRQSKRIVLDLTDLRKMDSMGLGTLVRLYVTAKREGSQIELINLSRQVRELLGITNLLSVFEICGEQGMRLP